MTTPNDVKIARESRKLAVQLADRQLIAEVLKNPLVELVGGFAAVELIQKYTGMGEVVGTGIEAGLIGVVCAQQLAPIMPDLLASGKEGVEAIKDITTGLLPIAAGLL